jgi:hypothetical protein
MPKKTYNTNVHSVIGNIEHATESYRTITDKFSECVKGYFNTNEYFMNNITTTEADTLYIETDTLKCKIGNGTLSYSESEYVNVTPSEFVNFVSNINNRFTKERDYTHNNIGNLKARLRDMSKRVKDISDSLYDVDHVSRYHTNILLEHKDKILKLETDVTNLSEEIDHLTLKLRITYRLSIIACSLSGLGLGLSIISLLL